MNAQVNTARSAALTSVSATRDTMRCPPTGCRRLLLAIALAPTLAAAELIAPVVNPTTSSLGLSVTGLARTNPPAASVAAPRKSIRAVDLAETPSAAIVLHASPLLEKSTPAALVEMSQPAPSPLLDSRMNREAIQDSLKRTDLPYTPEETASAFQYLRHKPTMRGVWELMNPLAPLTKSETPAALAFETRREVGNAPRVFRDAGTHEPQLRLF